MEDTQEHKERFRRSRCCVIIPVHNNRDSIEEVLKGVLEHSEHLIVVDDGSDDGTGELLSTFPQIELIRFDRNRGKGYALRQAFQRARELGHEHAITMDADGQHSPEDLPAFLDELEKAPGALIVGARNMDQASVPGGSSFGNRFSNFWFRLETGIRLPDTQSGYRLYPLQALIGKRFFSTRYEFEIEVLVRAAWAGIPVRSIPVRVHYAPKEERVSHFRPYMDFFRISVMNSILVPLAFLWYRPMMAFRKWRRKGFKDWFREELLRPEEPVRKKSFAIAFGVFMGIVPIWGYQFASALFLAHLMRLNKVLVGLAAQISLPPMIPFILYGSYKTGTLILPGEPPSLGPMRSLELQSLGEGLVHYLVGAFVLAAVAALCSGIITFLLLRSLKTGKYLEDR